LEDLSVVIPTNRVDEYLKRAIESVFENHNVSIELVLVLDGVSLENDKPTWSKDNRIKIISNQNPSSIGSALNLGILQSKNEIIARLDSDDICYPYRFKKQLEILLNDSSTVLVGAQMDLIDQNDVELGAAKQVCGSDVRSRLLTQNVVPHSSFMFRKSEFIKIGMYKEDLQQMEDYDLLLRFGTIGKVSVICEPLIKYRIHANQTSKKASWRGNYIRAVLEGRRNLATKIGVAKQTVLVRNIFWLIVQLVRSLKIIKPRHLILISQKPNSGM
jgi:glycosyltransferase involved in cell wall biosynthesis